jgi:hypothetical protein
VSGGILGPGIDDLGQGRKSVTWPSVPATIGTRVTHRGSRFIGTVIGFVGDGVTLRGVSSDERSFRFTPGGFMVDAKIVTLVRPKGLSTDETRFTASGSVAAPQSRAKVARSSRLWVAGVHDAELVEKIWGDDLRDAGVVVERLDGLDHLAQAIDDFSPGPDARLGVLVDHLVHGSKEWRIAQACQGEFVTIAGHPFVDVWQAIRPVVLGIDSWPVIPRSKDWKTGICEILGQRLGALDSGSMWKVLLKRARTFADLEPAFIGAVESILDDLLIE